MDGPAVLDVAGDPCAERRHPVAGPVPPLLRVYPVDRVLAVFRRNAGLDTRGANPPGGWEGFGHANEQPWGPDDYPGRANVQTGNLLRGHYGGHFLSTLAQA